MLAFSDLTNAYKEVIILHLVTQEIISINTNRLKKPHFWIRDKKQSSAEVDMVYAFKEKIIPIEIKSGKTGTLRSLHQFIDRCNHPYAIRMYAGEFKIIRSTTPGGKSYYLMNMPYYLGTRLPEYIEYFVESSRQS